jgi:hypothetical protein
MFFSFNVHDKWDDRCKFLSSHPLRWAATLKCILDRFFVVATVSGQHQDPH